MKIFQGKKKKKGKHGVKIINMFTKDLQWGVPFFVLRMEH